MSLFMTGFEEQLCCPVCMCRFNEPKNLTCGHSFCLECLNRMLRAQPLHARTYITCPTCRGDTHLSPGEGVVGLPTNFIINSMVEALRKTTLSNAAPANMPAQATPNPSAPTTSKPLNKSGSSVPTGACARHMAACAYCYTCHIELCKRCYSDHESHDRSWYYSMSEVAPVLQKLEESLHGLAVTQLESVWEAARQSASLCEHTIDTHVETLKQLLDQRGLDLKRGIHEQLELDFKVIENQYTEMKTLQTTITPVYEQMKAIVSTGNLQDVGPAFERAEALIDHCARTKQDSVHIPVFNFNPGSGEEEIAKALGWVGGSRVMVDLATMQQQQQSQQQQQQHIDANGTPPSKEVADSNATTTNLRTSSGKQRHMQADPAPQAPAPTSTPGAASSGPSKPLTTAAKVAAAAASAPAPPPTTAGPTKSSSVKGKSRTIHIKGFPDGSENAVKQYLNQFGRANMTYTERAQGCSGWWAFVDFDTFAQARAAVDAGMFQINGEDVIINMKVEKPSLQLRLATENMKQDGKWLQNIFRRRSTRPVVRVCSEDRSPGAKGNYLVFSFDTVEDAVEGFEFLLDQGLKVAYKNN
eukprot:TRINITY_DN9599_c0_g2_i1.p1 TRINITY_DN9599_c0_g2~~TRINITY_DN9599_c0_g2_i1.p1  ORF type:complete len:585 (-),score=122.38 TRINITY_DN9599_c0_g2_i1:41-1795(-)